jgi:hypothetical protein
MIHLLTEHRWDAVIYAVDPHDGLRSGRYERIYHESPTYDYFFQNVRHYGSCTVISPKHVTLIYNFNFMLV